MCWSRSLQLKPAVILAYTKNEAVLQILSCSAFQLMRADTLAFVLHDIADLQQVAT